MRNRLTGGLTIVFGRIAVAGETPIHLNPFKEPLIAGRYLGIYANSLCLSCVAFSTDTKKRKIIGQIFAQNAVCPIING